MTITDVDQIHYDITVDTFQEHQGQDLGLWTARYPKVTSDSRSNYDCNTGLCDTSVCDTIPYSDCGQGVGVYSDDCGNICSHDCSCVNGTNPCIAHEPIMLGVDESL